MQRLLLAVVVVLAALLLARDPYVERQTHFFSIGCCEILLHPVIMRH